jgi:hypothetical protein
MRLSGYVFFWEKKKSLCLQVGRVFQKSLELGKPLKVD